jgi:hypothetical protein
MIELPETIAPLELISGVIATAGMLMDAWGVFDAFGDRRDLTVLRRLLTEFELRRRKNVAFTNLRHRLTHFGYQCAFVTASLAAMSVPQAGPGNTQTPAAMLITSCLILVEVGLCIESFWDRFGRWRLHGIIRETRSGDPKL